MNKKISLFIILVAIGLSVIGQGKIDSELLEKHVYFLASDEMEGRGFGTESGMKAADYIAEQFAAIGLHPIGDSYFHEFHARVGQTQIKGQNVVAMVEGSDPILKDEFIVLGAHYDHISYTFSDGKKVVYNGADDNATGTASIIEIGKELLKNRQKLKRSVILVAFDGEESGLLGSRAFVKQNTVPIEKVKLMMSLDMTGRYAESNSLIMGAMGSLKGGEAILKVIAAEHDVKIKRTGEEISSRTDSKPFGDAGVPALHVTSGIIGPYHKPEDDPETIDYAGMAKIANMLYDLTIAIANTEVLEPIAQLTAQAEAEGLPFFRIGVKGNIGGSAHIYPNEFYKGKSKFSADLGLMTQFKISNLLTIQPEVMYSTMGSKYDPGNFRTHSITTPLSLVITSNMERSVQQRFFATIGGYYSYHFAGRTNKMPVDFGNTFAQSETGITYGFGLEVMSFFLNVQFKHGLSNILLQENTDFIRTRGIYLGVGYMF